mmetsp:Transcript_32054/g.96038  ORF Transcript_32054/g.96038 Transcript_32054/m.96038 type:complete len:286 (+) Transcript_32054:527-1384(+)
MSAGSGAPKDQVVRPPELRPRVRHESHHHVLVRGLLAALKVRPGVDHEQRTGGGGGQPVRTYPVLQHGLPRERFTIRDHVSVDEKIVAKELQLHGLSASAAVLVAGAFVGGRPGSRRIAPRLGVLVRDIVADLKDEGVGLLKHDGISHEHDPIDAQPSNLGAEGRSREGGDPGAPGLDLRGVPPGVRGRLAVHGPLRIVRRGAVRRIGRVVRRVRRLVVREIGEGDVPFPPTVGPSSRGGARAGGGRRRGGQGGGEARCDSSRAVRIGDRQEVYCRPGDCAQGGY